MQGEYVEAERALSEALGGAEEDRELRFSCLLDLGWILMFTGKLDEAKARFESALSEAKGGLGPEHVSRAMGSLARALAERGDPVTGLELARDSLRLRQELDDERGTISARSAVARIRLLAGDPDAAIEEGTRARNDAESQGYRLREAEALFPLAAARYAKGDLDAAAQLAAARLQACGELGDALGVAEVLDLCAFAPQRTKQPFIAQRLARAANELRGSFGAERWPWDREQLRRRLGSVPDTVSRGTPISLGEALSQASEALASLGASS